MKQAMNQKYALTLQDYSKKQQNSTGHQSINNDLEDPVRPAAANNATATDVKVQHIKIEQVYDNNDMPTDTLRVNKPPTVHNEFTMNSMLDSTEGEEDSLQAFQDPRAIEL